jgi:hypothetical protein
MHAGKMPGAAVVLRHRQIRRKVEWIMDGRIAAPMRRTGHGELSKCEKTRGRAGLHG